MEKYSIIFVVLSLLLGSACQQEQEEYILLSGKAEQGVEKMILVQNQGMFRTVAESEVDADGNYCIKYEMDKPGLFLLGDIKYRKSVPVFGRPGDQTQVDFSGDKIDFSGDEKDNNEFLGRLAQRQAEFQKENRVNLSEVLLNRKFYLDRRRDMCNFIETAELKDQDFEGILLADEDVKYYGALLNYPSIYKSVTGKEPVLPDDYFDFMMGIDLSSPYLSSVGNVYPFLQNLFSNMETRGYLQVGLVDYLKKRGARIKDQELKEEYYLYALGLEQNSWQEHLDRVIASIEPEFVLEKSKQKLIGIKQKQTEMGDQFTAFRPGQPAYPFQVPDQDGQLCAFTDFRGKIVVIDVWNTGCVPCIAEIPYLKKLEKQFEGEEVVFLSYSLDTDRKKWLKFIDARSMEGHLLIDTVGFRSEFARYYQINSIPRFLIFDKQGNIADAFAPRPSDPKLALKLENLLKNQN